MTGIIEELEGDAKVVLADIEAFLDKAETEAEKLVADAVAAFKHTVTLIANDPKLKAALATAIPSAIATVLNAVEGNGLGAAEDAIKGAIATVVSAAEAPAKSAAAAAVETEVKAAVATALNNVPANQGH